MIWRAGSSSSMNTSGWSRLANHQAFSRRTCSSAVAVKRTRRLFNAIEVRQGSRHKLACALPGVSRSPSRRWPTKAGRWRFRVASRVGTDAKSSRSGAAQLGSGPRGRRFKSSRPDHLHSKKAGCLGNPALYFFDQWICTTTEWSETGRRVTWRKVRVQTPVSAPRGIDEGPTMRPRRTRPAPRAGSSRW
jgi:hypothetical protein